MKTLKFLSFILFLLTLALPLQSQENAVVPQRTPEQEAARQTEKLQKELNLSTEQTKRVYEINLRYARERQISNTRNEAIERMKNKNADIQRVLNNQQNEQLQSKRFERTSENYSAGSRNQSNVPVTFRSSSEFRSRAPSRVPSLDVNRRSVYHSERSSMQSGAQSPQTVHRGNSQVVTRPSVSVPTVRSEQPQQSSQTTRSLSGSSGSSSTRSESTSGSRR